MLKHRDSTTSSLRRSKQSLKGLKGPFDRLFVHSYDSFREPQDYTSLDRIIPTPTEDLKRFFAQIQSNTQTNHHSKRVQPFQTPLTHRDWPRAAPRCHAMPLPRKAPETRRHHWEGYIHILNHIFILLLCFNVFLFIFFSNSFARLFGGNVMFCAMQLVRLLLSSCLFASFQKNWNGGEVGSNEIAAQKPKVTEQPQKLCSEGWLGKRKPFPSKSHLVSHQPICKKQSNNVYKLPQNKLRITTGLKKRPLYLTIPLNRLICLDPLTLSLLRFAPQSPAVDAAALPPKPPAPSPWASTVYGLSLAPSSQESGGKHRKRKLVIIFTILLLFPINFCLGSGLFPFI